MHDAGQSQPGNLRCKSVDAATSNVEVRVDSGSHDDNVLDNNVVSRLTGSVTFQVEPLLRLRGCDHVCGSLPCVVRIPC